MLNFRADIKLATKTLEAIDAATLRRAESGLRPHLGASLIGRPCERALWYTFRWATAPNHEPRMLRLFARGQREEDNLAALLRAAGVTVHTVDPATGRQFSYSTGHFGGSMDGACVGLPDAPKTWHLLEFKTHSAKSFNELEKHGVKAAKPEHWAQMQCYMAWAGLTRALYVAVCKDDDRLHLERIDAEPEEAKRLMDKAQRIIDAPTPPERISDDPSYYLCKWCEHHAICHGTEVPLPTCRSCSHSTPEPGGTWTCARHQGKTLSVPEQRNGCQAHRYIPALLKNWAEPVDASDEDNWVKYQTSSGTFVNGAPPEGLSSEEIHAARDKRFLVVVVDEMMDLRKEFGAKVVA
jgi:hypothetical protein